MSFSPKCSSPRMQGGDQAGPEARPPRCRRSSARLVRVPRDRADSLQIAGVLARRGGVGFESGDAWIYAFPSESSRLRAVSAVRSVHGWTSVEPQG